jgi:hypothetical protein
MLEASVRWVIILLVIVFDPLALMLVLAANQSKDWDDEEPVEEKVEEDISEDGYKTSWPTRPPIPGYDDEYVKYPGGVEVTEPVVEKEFDIKDHPYLFTPAGSDTPPGIKPVGPQVYKPKPSDDTLAPCYKCGTPLMNAPGIGPFCPNKACDVMDGPFLEDEEPISITYVPPTKVVPSEPKTDEMFVSSLGVTVDSDIRLVEPEIVTENVTQEKVMYNYSDNHIIFEGKKMSIDNLRSIRPDLVLPQDGTMPIKIEFGNEFPKFSLNGDTYIRVDSIPHRVYKFNGRKWMAVDKAVNTTYLTNTAYLRYLIQKLELNEYDPEFLTISEQDEIEIYLTSKKG